MDLTIYTPGNPAVLADALRSVVMTLGTTDGFSGSYLATMTKFGMFAALLITLVQAVGNRGFPRFDRFFMFFVASVALMTPMTSVTVETSNDTGIEAVNYVPQVVDNVPLVVAGPLSLGTSVGHSISTRMQAAMRPAWLDQACSAYVNSNIFSATATQTSCTVAQMYANVIQYVMRTLNLYRYQGNETAFGKNSREFYRYCVNTRPDPRQILTRGKDYLQSYCDDVAQSRNADLRVLWVTDDGQNVGPSGQILNAERITCATACQRINTTLFGGDQTDSIPGVAKASGCTAGTECGDQAEIVLRDIVQGQSLADRGLAATHMTAIALACQLAELQSTPDPLSATAKGSPAASMAICDKFAQQLDQTVKDADRKIVEAQTATSQWLVLFTIMMPLAIGAGMVVPSALFRILTVAIGYMLFASGPHLVFTAADMIAAREITDFMEAYASPNMSGQCISGSCAMDFVKYFENVSQAISSAANFQAGGTWALLALFAGMGGMAALGAGGGAAATGGAGGQSGSGGGSGGRAAANRLGADEGALAAQAAAAEAYVNAGLNTGKLADARWISSTGMQSLLGSYLTGTGVSGQATGAGSNLSGLASAQVSTNSGIRTSGEVSTRGSVDRTTGAERTYGQAQDTSVANKATDTRGGSSSSTSGLSQSRYGRHDQQYNTGVEEGDQQVAGVGVNYLNGAQAGVGAGPGGGGGLGLKPTGRAGVNQGLTLGRHAEQESSSRTHAERGVEASHGGSIDGRQGNETTSRHEASIGRQGSRDTTERYGYTETNARRTNYSDGGSTTTTGERGTRFSTGFGVGITADSIAQMALRMASSPELLGAGGFNLLMRDQMTRAGISQEDQNAFLRTLESRVDGARAYSAVGMGFGAYLREMNNALTQFALGGERQQAVASAISAAIGGDPNAARQIYGQIAPAVGGADAVQDAARKKIDDAKSQQSEPVALFGKGQVAAAFAALENQASQALDAFRAKASTMPLDKQQAAAFALAGLRESMREMGLSLDPTKVNYGIDPEKMKQIANNLDNLVNMVAGDNKVAQALAFAARNAEALAAAGAIASLGSSLLPAFVGGGGGGKPGGPETPGGGKPGEHGTPGGRSGGPGAPEGKPGGAHTPGEHGVPGSKPGTSWRVAADEAIKHGDAIALRSIIRQGGPEAASEIGERILAHAAERIGIKAAAGAAASATGVGLPVGVANAAMTISDILELNDMAKALTGKGFVDWAGHLAANGVEATKNEFARSLLEGSGGGSGMPGGGVVPVADGQPPMATQPVQATAAPTDGQPPMATQPVQATAVPTAEVQPVTAAQPTLAAAAPTDGQPPMATQPVQAAAPDPTSAPPTGAPDSGLVIDIYGNSGTTAAPTPTAAAPDSTAAPTGGGGGGGGDAGGGGATPNLPTLGIQNNAGSTPWPSAPSGGGPDPAAEFKGRVPPALRGGEGANGADGAKQIDITADRDDAPPPLA